MHSTELTLAALIGAQHPGVAVQPLLASGFFLLSFWKPILLLLPLVPWALVVSKVLDKHAARFYLPRRQWNLAHMVVGVVAFSAAVLMPIAGEAAIWVGLLVMIVLLVADVVVFATITNKDEKVPEEHRLKLDFSKLAEARAKSAAAKKAGKAELVVRSPDKAVVVVPATDTPEFETRVAAEQFLLRALDARASIADLGPTGRDGTYGESFLVDGVRQAGQTMPQQQAISIIDFWKGVAKLDLADRRRKLTGDITVERGDSKKKVRLTSIGVQGGMKLSALFDPEGAVRRKAEQLGLLEPQAAELKSIIEEQKGIVVMAGPAHMGRTTTLYSIVRMHDVYTRNVQTIEIEQQDELEGVRQNKWDPQAEGPEFGTLVRSILRRDPDVVALAEVPDEATAKEVMRADSERVRVFVSFKGDGAIGGLQQWLKVAGDPDAAAKALTGAIGHKLIRKLCTVCRQAYVPQAEMLKKLGLPADKVKQLYKKGGVVLIKNKEEPCPACKGIGYVGQEGIFEVFKLGEAERSLIKAGDWNGLRAELRKRQLPTIQTVALRKAVEGVTSVEEVTRVAVEGAAAPASKPAGKPSASPGANPGSNPSSNPVAGGKAPPQPPSQKPPAQPPARPQPPKS